MLYDKLVKAWEEADVNLWDEIRHDEWEMLFHSDGRVVRKGDNLSLIHISEPTRPY